MPLSPETNELGNRLDALQDQLQASGSLFWSLPPVSLERDALRAQRLELQAQIDALRGEYRAACAADRAAADAAFLARRAERQAAR